MFGAPDVFSLQSLRSLLDVEFDAFPFIQGPVAGLIDDGGVVDEYVFTGFTLDEAVALVVVEPLDGACFASSYLRLGGLSQPQRCNVRPHYQISARFIPIRWKPIDSRG